MEISSYKKDPQNFLSELDKVELNQLRGADSTALDELVALLKKENIKITAKYDPKIDSSAFPDQAVTDDESLLRKLLAYFMPTDATIPGGIYDAQIRGGYENFKKIITDRVVAGEREYTLRSFLAVAQFSLAPDRIDDDVISVMTDNMFRHEVKRNTLKDKITDLTAELNIYSKVTTEINRILSESGTLSITSTGLNLLDPKLYGFSGSNADKFYQSAEYKLLEKIRGSAIDAKLIAAAEEKRTQAELIQQQLNRYSSDIAHAVYENMYGHSFEEGERRRDSLLADATRLAGLTIKQFLESPLKRTGALTGLKDSYAYDKDNNVLANFATTVNDRTRPLNDEVNQKTTELNDISSRYNSAIEALNRFIQKYESVMRDILQAI
ncbi:virulence-associated V antigen [Aeromonas hydrophila]|uniref:virulence-associated V antigen n=1 Tax=Aeromonas hydrophila TaxID=644 RepID=UPI0005A6BC8E|nr:virulence-associated V antigen [Aeromonas hydrophila]